MLIFLYSIILYFMIGMIIGAIYYFKYKELDEFMFILFTLAWLPVVLYLFVYKMKGKMLK